MFGYVVINKGEMKIKDFEVYRSFYCGLCSTLKSRYGLKGQLSLNYDLTFLAVLLAGLYEPDINKKTVKCIAHPLSKHPSLSTEFTEYAADMNILLTYYKCQDDWKDDRSYKKKIYGSMLKKAGKKVISKYPDKAGNISKELKKLEEYEQSGCTDIDEVAGCFGRIMAEVFTPKQDEWTGYLASMGFYMGKYLYILDAYNDFEEDIEKKRYNPLGERGRDENYILELLTLMMAECSKNYDFLPIVTYSDILDNIVYSGVWTGFYGKKDKPSED